MRPTIRIFVQALLATAATAQRTQSIWGQCGGSGYTGPTLCPQTAYCNFGNPWYSQCIPGSADEPLPGVPDSPIVTSTIQTIVTWEPPAAPDPIIITTFITYLTPSATQPPQPRYTVIDGITYTILPRGPVTDFLDPRAPAPTEPPVLLLAVVEPRDAQPEPEPDVDRAPVYDSPVGAGEAAAIIEARSPAPEPDVDRPPVYDSPIDAVFEEEVRKRDVDRQPVFDSPIVDPVDTTVKPKKRDVDRAPVLDSPIHAAEATIEGRSPDVDRPSVYDTLITPEEGAEFSQHHSERDVDRPPVYDTPITPEEAAGIAKHHPKRDVDRAPVYDVPISPEEAAEIAKHHPKRDVDRSPVYDVALEKPLPIPAGAQAPTPTILAKGQYWIRAVTSPNYHKYLQTKVSNTADVAILGPSKTAGQFSIQSGQLVEATGADPLYLHVERPADLKQRTLATWFNTTRNDFGTFAWQGDTLTWTGPEIQRQNPAAWLVCRNQALFINTGAYAYHTPAGCSDHTIHYYNDATAND